MRWLDTHMALPRWLCGSLYMLTGVSFGTLYTTLGIQKAIWRTGERDDSPAPIGGMLLGAPWGVGLAYTLWQYLGNNVVAVALPAVWFLYETNRTWPTCPLPALNEQ